MVIKLIGIIWIIIGLFLLRWGFKQLKNIPKPESLKEYGAIALLGLSVISLMLGGIFLLTL